MTIVVDAYLDLNLPMMGPVLSRRIHVIMQPAATTLLSIVLMGSVSVMMRGM